MNSGVWLALLLLSVIFASILLLMIADVSADPEARYARRRLRSQDQGDTARMVLAAQKLAPGDFLAQQRIVRTMRYLQRRGVSWEPK